MANQTDKPPYDAEATYDLTVAKPVSVGPFKYLPRHSIEAKGSLIIAIIEEYGPDAIRSAEPRG